MSEAPSAFAKLSRTMAAAPHRLLFLAGTIAVLLSMSWWAVELTWIRFGVAGWPQPSIPPGWAHAMLMQYGLFPPFMFGFLFTVFPRWLKQPELSKVVYVPVAGLIFGGYLLANLSLLNLPSLLKLGFLLMLMGYLVGTWALAAVLRASQHRNDHAYSCLMAVSVGTFGLVSFVIYLFGASADCANLAIKLGTFGLLLPVFFTVTHRMLPFFSGNIVKGYTLVQPRWSIPIVWVLLLAHALLDWRSFRGWLWLVDIPLAFVFIWHALAWQPWKALKPGLLAALHLAFAWLPLAFALYSAQDVFYVIEKHDVLGRAPLHAMAIGYFGSMLIAMVTRVTQGHSGRPLQMGPIPCLCFSLLQVVVLLRIGAEFVGDTYFWLATAAYGWIVAFLPWVLRSAWIYLTPRVDAMRG